MRVVLVGEPLWLLGGHQRALLSYVQAFLSQDYKVSVVCGGLRPESFAAPSGLTVIPLADHTKMLHQIRTCPGDGPQLDGLLSDFEECFCNALRNQFLDADFFLFFNIHRIYTAALARVVRRLAGNRPLISRLGSFIKEPRFRQTELALLELADHFIVPTPSVRHHLCCLGISQNMVTCIPNPIRQDFFRIYRVPGKQFRLLYPGRIVNPYYGVEWSKGLRELLQGFALARRHHPGLHLQLAGNDWHGAESSKQAWEELTRQGLTRQVEFLSPRECDPEHFPNTLAQADLVVMASLLPEPYGNSVWEALAASRPTITSTAVASLVDAVQGESQLPFVVVLPEVRAEILAEEISALAEDGPLHRRLGENAHQVSARRSMKVIGPRLVETLEMIAR